MSKINLNMGNLLKYLSLGLLSACSHKQINLDPESLSRDNCNKGEIELSPLKDSYCIREAIAFREIMNTYNFINGDTFVRQNLSCRYENGAAVINTYSNNDLNDDDFKRRINKEVLDNILNETDSDNDYIITNTEGLTIMKKTLNNIVENLNECNNNSNYFL